MHLFKSANDNLILNCNSISSRGTKMRRLMEDPKIFYPIFTPANIFLILLSFQYLNIFLIRMWYGNNRQQYSPKERETCGLVSIFLVNFLPLFTCPLLISIARPISTQLTIIVHQVWPQSGIFVFIWIFRVVLFWHSFISYWNHSL